MSASDQLQPLASGGERKAFIVPVDRFAGVDAVFLLALGDIDPPIEGADLREIGEFINGHLAAARGAGAERGGDTAGALLSHADSPVDWQLANFANFVRERGFDADELRMALDVAEGVLFVARHTLRGAV